MAKINKPPFSFSGRLGDYVYYKLRGKYVVRKKPGARKNAPSVHEQQTRSRFGFMTKFLSPLKFFFYETFNPKDMSPLNKALSVNLKHVIPESYPNWCADFSRILIGQGDNPGLKELSVNSNIPGQLEFTWNAKSRQGRSRGEDQIYVAVYCEDLNLWLTYCDAVYRRDGSFILDVEIFRGFRVHGYIGIIAKFWRTCSDSQYAGSFYLLE